MEKRGEHELIGKAQYIADCVCEHMSMCVDVCACMCTWCTHTKQNKLFVGVTDQYLGPLLTLTVTCSNRMKSRGTVNMM